MRDEHVGCLAIGLMAAAGYGLWIVVKYAGWPAMGAIGLLATGFALYRSKAPLARALAPTALAAGLAFLPHVAFLMAYNIAASHMNAAAGAPGEPTLFGLASAYEDDVVALHGWFERHLSGWRSVVAAIGACALVIALAAWRVGAGKAAARAKAIVAFVQVFVTVAASISVLSAARVRDWSPDFGARLEARLVELDRARAEDWLLRTVKADVIAQKASLQVSYGPPLARVSQKIDALPPGARTDAVVAVEDQFAQDLADAAVRAQRQGLGAAPKRGGLGRKDATGEAGWPLPSAVRAVEKSTQDAERRADVDREAAIDAIADVLSEVHVGAPLASVFAKSLVSGLVSVVLDDLVRPEGRKPGDLAARLQGDPQFADSLSLAIAALLRPSARVKESPDFPAEMAERRLQPALDRALEDYRAAQTASEAGHDRAETPFAAPGIPNPLVGEFAKRRSLDPRANAARSFGPRPTPGPLPSRIEPREAPRGL